jgi:hypothetical protein
MTLVNDKLKDCSIFLWAMGGAVKAAINADIGIWGEFYGAAGVNRGS